MIFDFTHVNLIDFSLFINEIHFFINIDTKKYKKMISITDKGEQIWEQYTDVDNEKKTKVELDGNYMIDLENLIQYEKDDSSKRQSIKHD